MIRKATMMVCLFCLGLLMSSADAEDFVIRDYLFTWYIAKAGNVTMDIQKSPQGIAVILKGVGGPLATLSIPPEQAKEIGKVLEKTEDYFLEQKKSDEWQSTKKVPVGNYLVTFSSKQGSSFVVTIAEDKTAGAAVLLGKEAAINIGSYLWKAPAMAKVVDHRINW